MGLSSPFDITCDMTAPIPYAEASAANRSGRSGLQWTRTECSTTQDFALTKAGLHSRDHRQEVFFWSKELRGRSVVSERR